MTLNNYDELCRKYGVEMADVKFLLDIGIFVSDYDHDEAFCVTGGNIMGAKIILHNFSDEDKELIAFLHEVGHTKHDLGNDRSYRVLTRELAANTWVLDNYVEHGLNKHIVIACLKEWIMAYIPTADVVAEDWEDLRQTAKELGISNTITWTKHKRGD